MSETDKSRAFLESLYKPINPDIYNLRLKCETQHIPIIMKETEGMLSVLLDMIMPSHILEIGTAIGYSSIFFASKCSHAHISTIERSASMASQAIENIQAFNYSDRIEVLHGDAITMLDAKYHPYPYDFVFIDGGKTHYKEYFDLIENICTENALIVCDNVLIRGWIYDKTLPGAKRHVTNVKYMKEFLSYIKARDDISTSISSVGDGLAIIKINGK